MMTIIIIRGRLQGSAHVRFNFVAPAFRARRSLWLGRRRGDFIVALTTAGAMGLPGALLRPLQREYGWSEADISSALALRIFLFGLMAPFAAALIERYGLKRVILSRDRHDQRRPGRGSVHDEAVASGACSGASSSALGTGLTAMVMGGDRLDALVRRAARAGARHSRRQHGDGPARVPAARGGDRGALGLARGGRCRRSSAWRSRRSPSSRSWSTVRRISGLPPMARQTHRAAARHEAGLRRGVPRARRGRA